MTIIRELNYVKLCIILLRKHIYDSDINDGRKHCYPRSDSYGVDGSCDRVGSVLLCPTNSVNFLDYYTKKRMKDVLPFIVLILSLIFTQILRIEDLV